MLIHGDPNTSFEPKESTGTISEVSSGTFTLQPRTGIPFSPIPVPYRGTWVTESETGFPIFTVTADTIDVRYDTSFITARYVDCRKKTYDDMDALDKNNDTPSPSVADKGDYPGDAGKGYMMNGFVVDMTPDMSAAYGFKVGDSDGNLIFTFFLHKDDPKKALVFSGYDGSYTFYQKQ